MNSHHELLLFSSRRFGCWATCGCGEWRSGLWTTTTGAVLEFGEHLVEEARQS